MRLMRVGARGADRPVVLDADDRAYDSTPMLSRIDHALLRAGDVVELEIDGLDRLWQPVRRG